MPSKKLHNGGLGRALQNKLDKLRTIAKGDKTPIFFQETEKNQADIKKQKMQSILEQNSLNDFLQQAQLSQQSFESKRDLKFKDVRQELKQLKIVSLKKNSLESNVECKISLSELGLQLPIRPNWSQFNKKEELEQAENEAYLDWRRKLAHIEETEDGIHITPYEKNVEVWRQLWRVIQRSDLLVQIVDARDPLFFRCEGLEKYVQCFKGKRSFLLINKSDLVPPQVRKGWHQYFNFHHLDHAFFSAKIIAEELKSIEVSEQLLPERLLSVQELKALFDSKVADFGQSKEKGIEVGFVGYPNVGKSSVINALIGRKKVGVASMPGKTKHFQTLVLTDLVTLCDCPGLVFPKVAYSLADMVLNGLYPIDTLKHYQDAIEMLTLRIPCEKVAQQYALHWLPEEEYTGPILLDKYALLKGYSTGNGVPNRPISARYIIKDYVNGTLVAVKNPPKILQQPAAKVEMQRIVQEAENAQEVGEPKVETGKVETGKVESKQKNIELSTNKETANEPIHLLTVERPKLIAQVEKELDNDFFQKKVEKKRSVELASVLTEEHLLDILEGRQTDVHISKEMRRDIKHAVKQQGKGLKEIQAMLRTGPRELHKKAIFN